MANGNSNGHHRKNTGNGAHRDTAPASSAGEARVDRNGNGHKLDAPLPAEHELLWDGLSPAVANALGEPLDPSIISSRKGRSGRFFDYLEGHVVIEQANRIFGRGGWGYEQIGDVTLRQIETVDPQTGEIKIASAYSATVRVTVAGALPRTDTGFHPVAEETLDGHDTAIKAAVTDGMKRAFRSFGVQFGNGFYGDQSPASAQPRPERVPVPANGNSGQPQAKSSIRQAQSPPSTGSRKGRSESQAEKLRRRLIDIALEQGFDEDGVRSAVVDRMGKGIDELTAHELGPLVEAAAEKLRQMQQAEAA